MVETKLDPKEEKQYEQLRRLGQKLHIPIPEAFLTLEVFDKDGKLIQKHHQRSHSWTRNAYNMMFSGLAGVNANDAGLFEAGKLSIKDTTAAIRTGLMPIAQVYSANMDGTSNCYRAAGGIDTKGILVGSGVNAESFEDFALQTPIAEGAGGGQLNHAASEPHSISYGALVLANALIRYFNNNSGGTIDVNEVALVLQGGVAGSTLRIWVQSRDHLPVTVTVPDTGQLKVTYTIQLTYPA